MLKYRNELFLYHAAPAQPPLNVEWTLIGSQLSLYWEPVVAMESESEVTGYQVSFSLCVCFRVACLFLLCIRLSESMDLTCVVAHSELSDWQEYIFTMCQPPCFSLPFSCHTGDRDTKR